MASDPPVPRVMKPRRRGFILRPIIAVDQDRSEYIVEGTGEVLPVSELIFTLLASPSSIIVTPNAPVLLAKLHKICAADPEWQYRLTPLKRRVYKVNGEVSKFQIATTVVNFFGWQRSRRGKHRANLYHYPLDPYVFCRQGVSSLLPDAPNRLQALLAWGQDVRAWCQEQELTVSPTNGGLSAQLLRDERWWPRDRRKVPKATNARVRPVLPGNHYHLYCDEGEVNQAYYLDMSASHHTIASQISFPNPDSLVGRGFFKVTDEPGVTVADGRPWARVGSRSYRRVLAEGHGLLYAHLSVRKLPDTAFVPPYLRNPGQKMAWIFTNELPMLRELNVTIDWLTAAWVSFTTDPGMNEYARYALSQLAQASQARRRWLKPTLLSAYGILAAPPARMEFGYYRAKGGEPRQYPAGSNLLPVMALETPERESPIANVMMRGMIEAEQRMRALGLARYLHGAGMRVLAVYADSVFVESGRPLPFLPDGWKVDAELDRLQFASSTAFTSVQMTKLPGIPRETAARFARIEAIRNLNRPASSLDSPL